MVVHLMLVPQDEVDHQEDPMADLLEDPMAGLLEDHLEDPMVDLLEVQAMVLQDPLDNMDSMANMDILEVLSREALGDPNNLEVLHTMAKILVHQDIILPEDQDTEVLPHCDSDLLRACELTLVRT